MDKPLFKHVMHIETKRIIQLSGIFCIDFGSRPVVEDGFVGWRSGALTVPFSISLTSPTLDGDFTGGFCSHGNDKWEITVHACTKENISITRQKKNKGKLLFDLFPIGNNIFRGKVIGWHYNKDIPIGIAQCLVTEVPPEALSFSEESLTILKEILKPLEPLEQ